MSKVYAMIADGTEEVECLTVVDLLRRAGITTALVSVGGREITSSHKVVIRADMTMDQADFSDVDLIFLPGGMPGSTNLANCEHLSTALAAHINSGKRVAAICAAPSVVLGEKGFLRGKKATCFPGFEGGMTGATVMPEARVVTDGMFTTSRGLGCAVDLGLELIKLLAGEQTAEKVKKSIQY